MKEKVKKRFRRLISFCFFMKLGFYPFHNSEIFFQIFDPNSGKKGLEDIFPA
jgi:hypothetical protein